MCLDVAHCARIDSSLAIGRNQQVGLRPGIRGGERAGTSPMIFGTGANNGINMVPILLCVGEIFQDEYTDPLTPHIAIGLS